MALTVVFHLSIGCVTINKKNYTHKELEAKIKNSIEVSILKTLKDMMIHKKVDMKKLKVKFLKFNSLN